jgi:hypothetical protein
MASTIKQLTKRQRGRPPKYDWDLWGDGQSWVCHEGTDFFTSTTSFRALVHRTANSRGCKAETTIDKNNKSVSFRWIKN